jgi:hypothetical protein
MDTDRLVDSLPEEAYDDIVKLAARLCDAPTALVSLIDRDRQWFKAKIGFEATETPRDQAFCDHAIRQPDQLMEVADATCDPRFSENPLVTGESAVRFYAGMPLVTPGGTPMGTVCVLDRKPRMLDSAQRDALSALARLKMNLFEAHHRERELQRALLFASPHPVAPLDPSSQASAAADVGCTVVIVQVQQLDGAAIRLGDRALARLLGELDAQMAACIGPADCVDRSTGSGELILLMRGPDAEDRLLRVGQRLAEFEAQSGLRILWTSASSCTGGERMEAVFMRADAALTALKDNALAA